MIDCNCRWGVLVGGNQFMVFYLDRVNSGNETYHHLVVSDRHDCFHSANSTEPWLSQVLIALLLGGAPMPYHTTSAPIGTRYVSGTRSKKSQPRSKPSKPMTTGTSTRVTRSKGQGGAYRRGFGSKSTSMILEGTRVTIPPSPVIICSLANSRVLYSSARWHIQTHISQIENLG